jgi:surface polysaccharide O-acyltransferase-like enzyme
MWPIIIFSLNNLLSFLFLKIKKLSIKNLILQLLTGHVFMTVLWFQYDLIFITLFTFMIHLLFNENIVFHILINLKIFGIFLTYSNYNFYYFSKYDFNKKYTFGRFFEIIPYCITGYIFAYLNIVHILSMHRKTSINILLPILILVIKYKIFLGIKGFLFQGLNLYALTISIFFLFSLIPNEKIRNKNIIKFIEFISNHTAGVYYIHKSLYDYLSIFSLVNNKKLNGSIIIYILYSA